MKKITLLFSFIACVVFAQAQTLLTEDFNYTVGTDILSQGWARHSGTSSPNDSILVTDGLTFTGYVGSGIGGAAILNSTNKDQNKTFTAQTTGSVYASFMMKAGSSNRQGYFFNFASTPLSGNVFLTRVWVNSNGTGTGIGTYGAGLEPSPYLAITANTTYLIVVKYDFSTKISSLYVFNTMPSSEPTTAQATYTETATIANVGAVCLRQYTWTGSTTPENIVIDGIRVATSWNALFTVSDISTPKADLLSVSLAGKSLSIKNATDGSIVDVYSSVGSKVQSAQLVNGAIQLNNLSKGLYIVRIGNQSSKIML